MISEGYVFCNSHPEDPDLKILTYSPIAQINGKWNDVTKNARGLIIRAKNDDFSDAVVVERPWKKFFTLSQHTSGWALGDEEDGASSSASKEIDNLDFDAPAEVTDKMDGSLCILINAPDGDVAISTKGSFASDQAKMYTKLLRENPEMLAAARKLKKENPNTTFLFEGIGKDNQIVVEYDKTDLSFIGAVNKNTGEYYSTSKFDPGWSDKGFSKADTMPATTLREALTLPDREGKEGMVVRIINNKEPEKQMQIKIKQDDYLKLHRLLSASSHKNVKKILDDSNISASAMDEIGRTGDITKINEVKNALDFFKNGGTNIHKRLYQERKDALESAILPVAKNYANAKDYINNLSGDNFVGDKNLASKNFALSIQNMPAQQKPFLFSLFRDRLNGTDSSNSLKKTFLSQVVKNLKED